MDFKVQKNDNDQMEHDMLVLKTKYKELLKMQSHNGRWPTQSEWETACDQQRVKGQISCLGDDDANWVLQNITIYDTSQTKPIYCFD